MRNSEKSINYIKRIVQESNNCESLKESLKDYIMAILPMYDFEVIIEGYYLIFNGASPELPTGDTVFLTSSEGQLVFKFSEKDSVTIEGEVDLFIKNIEVK